MSVEAILLTPNEGLEEALFVVGGPEQAMRVEEAEIVVLARRDGLYDILKHPRAMLKKGLCKRERDGFVLPNARVVEIQEAR